MSSRIRAALRAVRLALDAAEAGVATPRGFEGITLADEEAAMEETKRKILRSGKGNAGAFGDHEDSSSDVGGAIDRDSEAQWSSDDSKEAPEDRLERRMKRLKARQARARAIPVISPEEAAVIMKRKRAEEALLGARESVRQHNATVAAQAVRVEEAAAARSVPAPIASTALDPSGPVGPWPLPSRRYPSASSLPALGPRAAGTRRSPTRGDSPLSTESRVPPGVIIAAPSDPAGFLEAVENQCQSYYDRIDAAARRRALATAQRNHNHVLLQQKLSNVADAAEQERRARELAAERALAFRGETRRRMQRAAVEDAETTARARLEAQATKACWNLTSP